MSTPAPEPTPLPGAWAGPLTYFALAFAISWGGVVVTVGLDGFPGSPDDFRSLLPMVVLAMLVGPSVAGIAATALCVGPPGLRDMWRRLRTAPPGARWYAAALLIAPAVVVGVLLALSRISPVFRPGILTVGSPTTHLVLGLLTGIVAGLFEEVGWTGFAIPRLRLRLGVFVTGLVVGLAWGAWHLLVVWWGSAETAGGLSMAVYLPTMAFSFLVPYRVLMVWIYDRTDSLGLAMGMHASLTASVRIFDPVPIAGWSIVLYNLALGAALAVVAVFVAIAIPGAFRNPTAATRSQQAGTTRARAE